LSLLVGHLRSLADHAEVAEALLELNANIHLENNQGFTALRSPSLQRDPISMEKLILTKMLVQVCRHPTLSPAMSA
jgi:ankyrin repeat protein